MYIYVNLFVCLHMHTFTSTYLHLHLHVHLLAHLQYIALPCITLHCALRCAELHYMTVHRHTDTHIYIYIDINHYISTYETYLEIPLYHHFLTISSAWTFGRNLHTMRGHQTILTEPGLELFWWLFVWYFVFFGSLIQWFIGSFIHSIPFHSFHFISFHFIHSFIHLLIHSD